MTSQRPISRGVRSRCLSGCKFRNNVGNFGGFLSINKLSQNSMTQTESAILGARPAMCASGVVWLRGKHAGGERYFPCVNISGEPEAYFRTVAGRLAAGRNAG